MSSVLRFGSIALVIPCVLAAQSAILRISVVSGEGVVHAAGSHAANPLTVEVADEAGRPVAGARVSFQTPAEGSGGTFSSGLRTDLTVTDASGRATVRGLSLNRIPGAFVIRITAAKEQARAGVVVKQYIGDAKAPGTATGANRIARETAAGKGKDEAEPGSPPAGRPAVTEANRKPPDAGGVKASAALMPSAGNEEAVPDNLRAGGAVSAGLQRNAEPGKLPSDKLVAVAAAKKEPGAQASTSK